jgi:tetratricopeptide (TPR) repeat protein
MEDARSAERLLAQAQNNYAGELGELGRRDEALKAAKRACDLFEMMDSRTPGSCEAELATSRQVLSTMLASAGQRRESLEPLLKALEQREAMAEKDRELLPSFASSLNTLAIRLVEVGELHDALLLVQRAVQIRSDLYDQNRDAWAADLAYTLDIEGMVLAANGAISKAIEST